MSADETVAATVDLRPISLDLAGAAAYTGLSKWRLNELARLEQVAVVKEGAKNLFLRASLDRYIGSLPPRGTTEVAE